MALLQSEQKLKAGDPAPAFLLKGVDGKMHSLQDYFGAKAFLVVFMCNHCPYVKAKFSRLNQIYEKYFPLGLKMVGINPNDAQQYPEDSFENMKRVAAEQKFKFDYLYDETQEVAKAYGAVCTPDPFLFDSQFRLAYHGRLDDALSPDKTPTKFEMERAIDAVLAGKKPPHDFLYSQGCSIKWKI
ncbi:MAG: thioredoxin family protein [Candidatus Micrarchaeota archaeon]|nr:thioredoxin family protein [Candidatus Micrarchaeota archaeon]